MARIQRSVPGIWSRTLQQRGVIMRDQTRISPRCSVRDHIGWSRSYDGPIADGERSTRYQGSLSSQISVLRLAYAWRVQQAAFISGISTHPHLTPGSTAHSTYRFPSPGLQTCRCMIKGLSPPPILCPSAVLRPIFSPTVIRRRNRDSVLTSLPYKT